MEDQHSQHSTQIETQHHKDGRLVRRLKTAWLSNTTNHKNPILKYDEGLGNQLMHRLVYTRERKHIGTKWSRVTCLDLLLVATQSLECQAPGHYQSRRRLTIATGNKQYMQINK
jgi:hypothetical protein